MKLLFTTLKKTLFWSYERGSWQYDVMCVLILAFVFFAPNSLFQSPPSSATESQPPYVITGEQLGAVEPGRLEEAVGKYLQASGHDVKNPSIEKVTDESGKVKYLVYER